MSNIFFCFFLFFLLKSDEARSGRWRPIRNWFRSDRLKDFHAILLGFTGLFFFFVTPTTFYWFHLVILGCRYSYSYWIDFHGRYWVLLGFQGSSLWTPVKAVGWTVENQLEDSQIFQKMFQFPFHSHPVSVNSFRCRAVKNFHKKIDMDQPWMETQINSQRSPLF